MSEPVDLTHEPTEAELAALDAILADESLWNEPPPGLEDLVVAAITAEASSAGPLPSADATVLDLADRRRDAGSPRRAARRPPRRLGLVVAGAAAAAVALVAVVTLRPVDDGGTMIALGPGPKGSPSAAADARIEERPDGTRILLDVKDLPPAPPGTYYEAWLRKNPEIGVSAGTFHMRGGGETRIELWSGVSPRDYPLFTVTIQQESAGAPSSGQVVLTGRIG